jgi:transcriptional regulator with XRE-family HTH domain
VAAPRFRPEILIEARRTAGLTQAGLARLAARAITEAHGENSASSPTEAAPHARAIQDRISAWERGVDAPTAPYLPVLGQVLGLDPVTLLDVEADSPPFTALRLASGWTLKALEKETGINYSSLHRMSHGAARLSDDAARRLAKALHVSRAELIASIERERQAK